MKTHEINTSQCYLLLTNSDLETKALSEYLEINIVQKDGMRNGYRRYPKAFADIWMHSVRYYNWYVNCNYMYYIISKIYLE